MTQELIFHLGDPKTGSTSIQHTLSNSTYQITGKSLYFSVGANHINYSKALNPKEPGFPKQHSLWTKLATNYAESDADIGVISAENFSSLDPELLEQAIGTHFSAHKGPIRLIAYVRPHAERLVSAFAERTKAGGFDGTMDELHDRLITQGLLDYTPRFTRWRNVFGDAFTLRPMVRSRLHDNDVVVDFFSWILGDTPFTLTQQTRRNEALSVGELTAMAAMHRPLRKYYNNEARKGKRNDAKVAQQVSAARTAFGWHFARVLSDLPREGKIEKPALHRALAEKVVETYLDDAKALDAAFFADLPGGTTPMADALLAAPGKALATKQSADFSDYYSPDEARLIKATGLFFKQMMRASPEAFLKAARGLPDTFSVAPERAGTKTGRRQGAAKGESASGSRGSALNSAVRRAKRWLRAKLE